MIERERTQKERYCRKTFIHWNNIVVIQVVVGMFDNEYRIHIKTIVNVSVNCVSVSAFKK